MIYILLSIIFNTLLFLSFKSFTQFRINTFQAIVINYFVCVIAGIIHHEGFHIFTVINAGAKWTWFGVILGLQLMIGFYIMAITSQRLGVSVATIASKMSLVLPILFSLFFITINQQVFSPVNYAGMALAPLAIFLGSVKKKTQRKKKKASSWMMLMPVAVFITGGFIDITINYSNHRFINTENEQVFMVLVFLTSGIFGLVIWLFNGQRFEFKSLIGGLYLGIANYLSLFFVLKGLSYLQNNGALFYPVVNIGIILLTSISAIIVFREKLSGINVFGLVLAVLALILLSYQDIVRFLDLSL